MIDKENLIDDAKKATKYNIKFLQSILKHLNSISGDYTSRAVLVSYCLDRYIKERLMEDIEKLVEDNLISKEH